MFIDERGEPENPLGEEDFRDRFDGLMAYAGQKNGNAVYKLVNDGCASVRDIMKYV